MSSLYGRADYFTDCKIEFPTQTYCGKVLNDIFKLGLSINQFQDKYEKLSKSHFNLDNPKFQSCIQYNLKTDVWGPKELVMINRGGSEVDVAITYGIRERAEFQTVVTYLRKQPNAVLTEDKPGMRMFQIDVPVTSFTKTRRVALYVQTYTEQATYVVAAFDF